jgi:hypothetical protein
MIADGTIVDADVNASAAIAGTKISPNFGSQNVVTSGTSTAASLIPTGSTAPTNGVYLPAANSVGISTNGTGRLFVDASGRVGVGGTPSIDFEITSALPIARFRDTTDNSYGEILNNNGTLSIRADENNVSSTTSFIDFRVDGSEQMRLTSSGRLGLGTSSPSVGLHYRDNQPKLRLASNNALDATAGTKEVGRLEWEGFRNTNVNTAASIRARQDGTWSTVTPWNSPTALEFYTQDNTGVEVTIPRLTIDSSGRVGIGTTSPGASLEVSRGTVAVTDPNSITTGDTGTFGALWSQGANLTQAGFQIAFNTGNNNARTERARIDSSGRLLVGTSTAAQYNDFSGSIRVQLAGTNSAASSVQAASFEASSFGPSYIFAKSRGATVGTNTIVSANDTLGSLVFIGADGTNWLRNASIGAQVDGTPGTNDMPGRLVFSTTASGASSPTERMRITSAGGLSFNAGFGSVAPAFGCRAWVNFSADGGTITVRASGGVSSVTRSSAGSHTINLSTAMPDTNFCVNVTCAGAANGHGFTDTTTKAAVQTRAVATPHALTDAGTNSVTIHR